MVSVSKASREIDSPIAVVSCDSHIGPPLDLMRPYCPDDYRDDFDDFVAKSEPFDIFATLRPSLEALSIEDPEAAQEIEVGYRRNLGTAGHYDMQARLGDMNREGIAAQVIYHSSQNGHPLPFIRGGSLFFNPVDRDLEYAAVGLRMYNDWLADVCLLEPERHIGLAHVPIWDVDAAVQEVERASSVGLKGVNFPSPRPGILPYDEPAWEPFWSACEGLGMTLNTHVGGTAGLRDYRGAHALALMAVDTNGWLARRGLPSMLFSGVFERHPNLKLVLTEQNGDWWTSSMREYDSAYSTHHWQFKDAVPHPPSYYCERNVFIGGSYIAPFEVESAVSGGYAGNVLWGSDYPHAEGTYQRLDDDDAPAITKLALRYAFADHGHDVISAVLNENALRVFDLDGNALQAVADRISAPSLKDIDQPLSALPKGFASLAFRTIGPYG